MVARKSCTVIFFRQLKVIRFINFNASIGAVRTHLKMSDTLGFRDKVVKVDATRENRSFSCK